MTDPYFQTLFVVRMVVALLVSIVGGGGCAWAEVATSSIQILPVKNSFATILNDKHPGNRLGYRFHEHSPIVFGASPASDADAGIHAEEVNKLEREFQQAPRVFVFKHHQLETDEWLPQDWTFFLRPVADGVEMLWIVATQDDGLPEYHGVQQCFRLSGGTNEAWRQEIAKTPAFSEYDLWAMQNQAGEMASLTYVLRDGQWQALPASKSAVGARTPLGVDFDGRRSGGALMQYVGPYQAEMLSPIEHGLIVRNNLPETWVTGLYWQRTSHVTVHHPADCLHAIVNIGGIPPHSRRAIRGKIYWFAGDKRDLLKHFQCDFAK